MKTCGEVSPRPASVTLVQHCWTSFQGMYTAYQHREPLRLCSFKHAVNKQCMIVRDVYSNFTMTRFSEKMRSQGTLVLFLSFPSFLPRAPLICFLLARSVFIHTPCQTPTSVHECTNTHKSYKSFAFQKNLNHINTCTDGDTWGRDNTTDRQTDWALLGKTVYLHSNVSCAGKYIVQYR